MRDQRAAVAAVLFVATLLNGCTPTVSRLRPYRDDPEQSTALENRANTICGRHRGRCDLPPHHFTTDGCSLWPDGTWVDCCVDHDIAYWCGGSCEDRAHADATLRQCVTHRGSASMGTAMYVGVRAGGAPWLPFPFRWGYGWDWPHGYESVPRPTVAGPPDAGGCAMPSAPP